MSEQLFPAMQLCDRCQYLETSAGFDWYHCPGWLNDTLIYRYGPEIHEYGSTPVYVLLDPYLGKLACARCGTEALLHLPIEGPKIRDYEELFESSHRLCDEPHTSEEP